MSKWKLCVSGGAGGGEERGSHQLIKLLSDADGMGTGVKAKGRRKKT